MEKQDCNNRVVDAIYDAIVDEKAWQALPPMLARATTSDAVWILERGASSRQPGRSSAEAAFRASALYGDLLAGRADVRRCRLVASPTEADGGAVAVHRGPAARDYNADDDSWFAALHPHLVRLLRTRGRQAAFVPPRRPFEALLADSDPVFLCNADALVIEANVAAIDLLAEAALVTAVPARRLRAVRPGLDVHHAVRDAVVRGVRTFHQAVGPDGRRFAVRVDRAGVDPALATVVVRDAAAHARRQVEAARQHYGLSPAEAALALALAQGSSIEQHALNRGLRLPTVRSQMSALLAKSGVERQAQFVAALHELPAPRPSSPA